MTDQEINEKVARKLGWTINTTQDYKPWYWPPGSRPESNGVRELPDYSGSIQAAWEIVEHIQNQRLWISLGFDGAVKRWLFRSGPFGLQGQTTEWSADTAPMAICKAFLKLT